MSRNEGYDQVPGPGADPRAGAEPVYSGEAPVNPSDSVKRLGFKIPVDCYMDCDIATPFTIADRAHDHDHSASTMFNRLFEEKRDDLSIFEERAANQINMIDLWSSGLHVGDLEEDQSDRRIWQYVSRRSNTNESLELAKRHVLANPDSTHDRGPVGSLPVHMCFLINSPFHRTFGMFMIEFDDRLRSTPEGAFRRRHLPRLIDIPYCSDNKDDDMFHGQNLLHCALVHRDSKLVEWLLERSPRLILGFCSGTFYGPTSPCYFGSTPLHFAAVTGQKDMVEKILSIAADLKLLHAPTSSSRKQPAKGREIDPKDPTNLCNLPVQYRGPLQQQRFLDQPDHWGNNILHMLVACSGRGVVSLDADDEELDEAEPDDPLADEDDAWLCSMYNFIVGLEEKVRQDCFTITGQLHSHRLSDTVNRNCHVPLVMAAAVGNRVMFKHILNQTSVINWGFGPIVCKSYSLEAFDCPPTLHPQAPSALEVLVEDPGPRHVRFFKDPVIVRVVNKNWAAYAQGAFHRRLALSMLCGIFIMMSCITESASDTEADGYEPPGFLMNVVAVIGRLGLALAAGFLLKKETRVIYSQGLAAYLHESGAAFLENVMSWVFVVSVTGSLILPWIGAAEALCHASLALVCVAYCGYLFYFFLGFELTGGYLVMIFEMVKSDMMRFSATFATLILGFACGFFLLFMEASLEGFAIMLRDTFLMAVGQYDAAQFLDCRVPWLCTVLMCLYIVVVNVLLFNLLIATMGETYGRMFGMANQTWMMERCRIMLSIKSEVGDQNPSVEYFVMQRLQIGLCQTGGGAAPADLLDIMDEVRDQLAAEGVVSNLDAFSSTVDHDGTGTDMACNVVRKFEAAKASRTTFQRFMVAVEPFTQFDATSPGVGNPNDIMEGFEVDDSGSAIQ